MNTQDQLIFFVDFLKEEGKLEDDRDSQVIVNDFLRRNGNFPRDIGA